MNPVEFKEQNVVIAKDQPEYNPLPAYKERYSTKGEVISCWRLTFWERIRVLFTGRIWNSSITFHNPLQPTYMTTRKWDILNKEYFTNKQDHEGS